MQISSIINSSSLDSAGLLVENLSRMKVQEVFDYAEEL